MNAPESSLAQMPWAASAPAQVQCRLAEGLAGLMAAGPHDVVCFMLWHAAECGGITSLADALDVWAAPTALPCGRVMSAHNSALTMRGAA